MAEKLKRQQKKDNEEAAKQLGKEICKNKRRMKDVEAAAKALLCKEEKVAQQLKLQL